MKHYKIAVLAGDGIGPEIMEAVLKILADEIAGNASLTRNLVCAEKVKL